MITELFHNCQALKIYVENFSFSCVDPSKIPARNASHSEAGGAPRAVYE